MSKAPQPAKKTPPESDIDSVIDESSIQVDDGTPVVDDLKMPEEAHPSRWTRFKRFISTHRTRTILIVGLLLILPTAAWAYYVVTHPTPIKEAQLLPRPEKPKTKASPLTGVQIAPELADRPILGVVIENHPDARPQSGLSQAGVVYEALAEGGITRFLAFFLDERPANIGPVRSLRTYFVDWGLEFNSPVAHVGGNAAALDLVGPTGLKDINQFYNGNSFFRTSDRIAPHNAYTNSNLMDALLKKNGWDKPAEFKVSPRQNDAPAKSPLHPIIGINYSYADFQVEYRYDAACNCYNRFLAGKPHVDRNTGQQIKVKNVVVEYMPTSYGKSRIGEQMTIMATPGSGRAVVFRDGEAIEGNWSKSQHQDRTKLTDAAGKEIPLNRGNTWYPIVPTDKTVSY
ncbi:DUF3048 domain-containing protein [Patescibacteria group bacterium]|nr:MAG: DUF3048 domain-containing protein [Patescibacteria group bacterium]